MTPRVTISMPCWLRPQRTRRAITCILKQTMPDWHAVVIGDACPHFEHILEEGWLDDRRFTAFNTPVHNGGCGYMATNFAIEHAAGTYFLFYANDDIISPGHMEAYLGQIEGTDYDFVYCDYMAFDKLMNTKLRYARIGHSALIVRTKFLQEMPPHSPDYGHDFDLIRNMVKAGAKYRKAGLMLPTYWVASGNKRRLDPEGLD
jgi:hypothetical protein